MTFTDWNSTAGAQAGVNMQSVRFRNMTLVGPTTMFMSGFESASQGGAQTITLNSNANGNPTLHGAGVGFNNVTVNAGTFRAAGSIGFGTLTVAAGATADIRGCNWDQSQLVGPGSINRSISTLSFGPTIGGANPIAFTIPYNDANYDIGPTLTAGPGAFVSITAKASGGFTLNDPVGGNTFDLSVVHP
jgi:hypothetical protein